MTDDIIRVILSFQNSSRVTTDYKQLKNQWTCAGDIALLLVMVMTLARSHPINIKDSTSYRQHVCTLQTPVHISILSASICRNTILFFCTTTKPILCDSVTRWNLPDKVLVHHCPHLPIYVLAADPFDPLLNLSIVIDSVGKITLEM